MREEFVLDSNVQGGGLQQALIDRFLRDTQRGTAEQFATAFVLLTRSLGIEARGHRLRRRRRTGWQRHGRSWRGTHAQLGRRRGVARSPAHRRPMAGLRPGSGRGVDDRGASAARTAGADSRRAPATDPATARTRQRDTDARRGRHHRIDQCAVDRDHVGGPRVPASVSCCSRSRPPQQSSRGSSIDAGADASRPPRRRSASAVHGPRPPTPWSTWASTSASRQPTARSSAPANHWSRTHVALSADWQHSRAPPPTAHRNTPTCWPRMRPGASTPSRSRWQPSAHGGSGSGGGSVCAPCARRHARPSPSDAASGASQRPSPWRRTRTPRRQ